MKNEKLPVIENQNEENDGYQALNFQELFEVQGGAEVDRESVKCGLGCFSGAVPKQL